MREYRFFAPTDFDSLLGILAQQSDAEVKYLAGGTDLVPRINLERDALPYEEKLPMAIVSLSGLGMNSIEEKDGAVVIAAMCTLSEIKASDLVRNKLPALHEALCEMAGMSVRNAATIGGNIMNASPAADSLPPLLVYDAELALRGPAGERIVPLKEFLLGPGRTAATPGEVLCSIIVKPGKGKSAFKKLGRRAAETLSVVNAAAYIELDGEVCTFARVAVGSAAATVVSCDAAAKALLGKKLDAETIKAAAELVCDSINPIDDIRSSAWYRLKTAPVMAARAIETAVGLA